ncbi:MAG: 6,7-dimethyl-8-ribityllumazine synthase [Planctomycetota bacterium]
MVREFHGNEGSIAEYRHAIVVSKYHLSITQKLLDGALKTLRRSGVPEDNIDVFWVPGSWELPTGVQIAAAGDYQAAMVFGCVIRGETTHDQHINTTVSNSIGRLSVELNLPIGFGLLTCNTMDQAIARSGGDVGNKGVETAEAVLQMVLLNAEYQKTLT